MELDEAGCDRRMELDKTSRRRRMELDEEKCYKSNFLRENSDP